MIFPVQYRLPTYSRWLLYDADHRNAYRYHRIFLQHLQSGVPGQWLLKSPAHLWHLDTLVGRVPRRADRADPPRPAQRHLVDRRAHAVTCAGWPPITATSASVRSSTPEEIVVGLDRSMKVRDSGVLAPGSARRRPVRRLHPPTRSRRSAELYAALGRELTPVAEQRMRDFLAAHPGDGGGARYKWADTGLDADEVREQVAGLPGPVRRADRGAEVMGAPAICGNGVTVRR